MHVLKKLSFFFKYISNLIVFNSISHLKAKLPGDVENIIDQLLSDMWLLYSIQIKKII